MSFYLYHVREDAHTKSQDWQAGNDAVPQRFKPMGVTLYYVLTPRSSIADAGNRAQADQLAMGLALKTLRDVPFIDDTTTIDTPGGPLLLMPATLRGAGNRFRALLQPTLASEATEFWQAGTQPLRLAAYYEVAATLLEPDEPQTRAGRVLMYGVHTFTRGRPLIGSVRNTITFTLPGEIDARSIDIAPAEVPFGDTLEVRGSDLKGDRTALLIGHRDFVEPIEVDAPWALRSDGSLLTVTVQPAIGATALVPGIYGATVRTTARKTLPDGTQRDFDAWSNQVGFAIAPAIAGVNGPGPVLTIDVDGFEPHLLAAAELLVFAGPARLTRVAASPPAAGEFSRRPLQRTARTTIRLRFPATLAAGQLAPVAAGRARRRSQGPWWETVP